MIPLTEPPPFAADDSGETNKKATTLAGVMASVAASNRAIGCDF